MEQKLNLYLRFSVNTEFSYGEPALQRLSFLFLWYMGVSSPIKL